MNKLEKDLNELLELSEQERFKPSPELLACGRLEKQNANLRAIILDLLPRRFQEWFAQAEQAYSYESAPIPRFLKETWNSNWDESHRSFAPTREFEGTIKGKVLKVVLEYSAIKVYFDGEYLTGIPLEN